MANWKDKFPKENIYFETENGILYHGDSIKILQEFPENSIDLIVTDPPYRVNFKKGGGSLKKKYDYRLEKLGELSNFEPLPFLKLTKKVLKKINMYIWLNKNLMLDYLTWINNNKLNFNFLIYVKTNPVPAYHMTYLHDKEFCLFIREKGVTFNNGLGYEMYKTIMIDKVNNCNLGHPTIKHLWMIEKIIRISSNEGEIILDPYLGSGTTAVACETLGRKWVGIEIKKEYCELAKKRILSEKNQKKLDNWLE